MEDVDKKVLFDLFISGKTVVPFVGGASLLMFGWALGSGTISFMGLVGLGISLIMLTLNFMFNWNNINKQVIQELKVKSIKEKEARLNDLDRRLRRNKDLDDQTHLRQLRKLYDGFLKDVESGEVGNTITADILTSLELMFQGCITSLEDSINIWEHSINLTGEPKKKSEKRRKKIVKEVKLSVDKFAETIEKIRSIKYEYKKVNDTVDLADLRNRLSQDVEVIEATNKMTSDLLHDNKSDFEEFENYYHEEVEDIENQEYE